MSESTVGSHTSDGPQQVTYSHGTKLQGSALGGRRHSTVSNDLGGEATELWSDRGCRRSINQLLQHPHKVGKQAYPHFSGRQLTHGEIQRTRSETQSVYVSYCLTMSGEWLQSEFLLDIVQGICLLAREPFWQLWLAERVEVPSLAVHWLGANAWGA